MMALRYALPALLLLYFVGRSFRQRIFLLGIPFLMYQNLAVFFDYARPFWIPGRFTPSDHVMMWLVIVWVIYFDLLLPAYRRSEPRPRVFGGPLSPPEELILLAFAALTVLEVTLTIWRFGDFVSALGEAKIYIYLFAGYFLLRGMLSRAGRSDTVDLVTALVVVNTVAAGLFVLHQGLQLPIYSGVSEYLSFTFMGQQITRSFYFMPQMLLLSLAYCVAKPKLTAFWVGVLAVTLAALWVSYTRTLLIGAVVVPAVVLGVRLIKARQTTSALRRVLAITAIVVVFGIAVSVLLPAQTQYFLKRIARTTQSGSVVNDMNLQNRVGKLERVYAWIGSESRLLGQGLPTEEQESTAVDIPWMSADLVWVPVLYHFGLFGVVTVVILYGTYGWRSARLALSGTAEAEFLSLVALGALAGVVVESFTSYGFLSPGRYPLGFWLLALIAAEACRRRAERASLAPVVTKEVRLVRSG